MKDSSGIRGKQKNNKNSKLAGDDSEMYQINEDNSNEDGGGRSKAVKSRTGL